MKIKNDISDLIELSKTIGEMPDLIQGGGGNISVKSEDGIMAIKASGMCLKDLDFNKGISFVQYQNILKYINEFKADSKSTINDFIKDEVLKFEDWDLQRPSIETGFHVVLDKYTIHSHSVYSNILCCSKEGKDISKKLFPDSIWIGYLPPGEALTIAIAEEQKKKRSSLYFIENHGVITTAESKNEALNLHLDVNSKIQNIVKVDDYHSFNFTSDINFMRANVLFPDQVVYTINDEVIKSVAAQETIKCYFYILNSIIANKLNPSFLSKEDVEFIDNMESEKYRKGLIKQ